MSRKYPPAAGADPEKVAEALVSGGRRQQPPSGTKSTKGGTDAQNHSGRDGPSTRSL